MTAGNETKNKKSGLYTKGGDQGMTSLVGGTRVAKSHDQIDLYGEVDELNAHLGHLRTLLAAELKQFVLSTDHQGHWQAMLEDLRKTQRLLFSLGAYLACEPHLRERYQIQGLKEAHVEFLEHLIDRLDGCLPSLKNFILPAGTASSTYAHVARTVCRRVERRMAQVMVGDDDLHFKFINRLSDGLFVMARFLQWSALKTEEIWVNEDTLS